jgi:hypothetical protein
MMHFSRSVFFCKNLYDKILPSSPKRMTILQALASFLFLHRNSRVVELSTIYTTSSFQSGSNFFHAGVWILYHTSVWYDTIEVPGNNAMQVPGNNTMQVFENNTMQVSEVIPHRRLSVNQANVWK